MTQVGRLRRGTDCEGVLVLVAEGDLILTSATATVFRRFWPHGLSGGCGPLTPGLTGTLVVAMTLMGS